MKDKALLFDIGLHSYRGVTMLGNLGIGKQYPFEKNRLVIVQDGTNAILKEKKNEEQLFSTILN